jgi:HEAT repeat protein
MAGLHSLLLACAILQPPGTANAPSLVPPRSTDAAALREKLYSRNQPQEQSQAALLLVQAESAEVAALVGFELTRWDRADVFQALATAIRLRRDVRFLQPMLDALGADQLAIRQSAIDTIAALPRTAVHEPLVQLAEERSALVLRRLAAVEAIGKVGAKQSVEALLTLLRSDSPAVRQAAVAALQEISGQDYGADPDSWTAWWRLYREMTDQDWQASRMRLFADKARRLRDDLDQAEKTLLELHKELLDRVLVPDLVNYLRKLTENPYPAVRELAVAKIAEQLAHKELEPQPRRLLTELLLHLSRDAHTLVQQRAVIALEKGDAPEVYQRLLDLLRDRSAKVRAAAARSLGNYRGQTSIRASQEATLAALESALRDTAPSVVASAATSIGALRMPRSGEILAKLLRHPAEEVRLASSAALEGIASCQVYDAVLAALDDSTAEARLYLVGCLARIGEYSGFPQPMQAQLIARLQKIMQQDGDAGVRSKAAAGLGKVGGPGELSPLWRRALGSEDARVQDNAWKAWLEIIDRQQSWPLLMQWERSLAEQGQGMRRLQLLSEMRERWSKRAEMQPHTDQISLALIDAALSQRKWEQAVPVCLELIRTAAQEQVREERLRLLLLACQQAAQEGKGAAVLPAIKEVEPMLSGFKELAVAFDELRRRVGPNK